MRKVGEVGKKRVEKGGERKVEEGEERRVEKVVGWRPCFACRRERRGMVWKVPAC